MNKNTIFNVTSFHIYALMPWQRMRFRTVWAEILRAALGMFLAVYVALGKRSRRCDVLMCWSSRRVVTRGHPLLGKSATDPVAANLLTVFRTVFLWIASRPAISLYCIPASTIPHILDLRWGVSSGILKLKLILNQNIGLFFYTLEQMRKQQQQQAGVCRSTLTQ